MKMTALSAGLTVQTPDDFEVGTGTGGQRGDWNFPASGSLELETPDDGAEPLGFDTSGWILPALRTGDMELLHELTIEPGQQPAGGRQQRGVGEDEISLSLDVAAGEVPVVLFEQEGMYRWKYVGPQGEEMTGGTRGGGGPVRRYVFTVSIGENAVPPQGGERGWLMDQIKEFAIGKIKAYVLKFVASATVETAGRLLSRHVMTRLVGIAASDPSSWQTAVAVPAPTAGKPPRILLFVHGTFSSTVGAFGDLGCTPWGRAFLAWSTNAYDAVIGFDHSTLTEDPLENARELLTRLQQLYGTDGQPGIDVIAHSRGGLVIRSLIEKLLPGQSWKPVFRRVIFVACTNEGTLLAKPHNWEHLINLYTNLITGTCRAVSFIVPLAAGIATIVSEVVKNIGEFVKYCADAAITDGLLPGLAAMDPDGSFVKDINLVQPGQPSEAESNYFVVTSDFQPSLVGDQQPKELPKRLLELLAAGVTGQLMQTAGDLVVNVSSMTAIDAAWGKFVRQSFDFGRNPQVYHTNYFIQPRLLETIQDWLEPGEPAGQKKRRGGITELPTRHAAMDILMLARLAGSGSELLGVVDLPSMYVDQRRGEPGIDVQESAPPAPRQPPQQQQQQQQQEQQPPQQQQQQTRQPMAPQQSPPQPQPPKKVLCYFKASMDQEVVLGHDATMVVEVSREELLDSIGKATAVGKGQVDAEQKILIRVLPQSKFVITDANDGREEIDLPDAGAPHFFYVDLRAAEEGAGEIWVLVRQGAVNILKLVLAPRVVVNKQPSAGKARAEGEGIPRPSDGRPINQLCIEEVEGEDGFYYRFDIYFAKPLFRRLGVKVYGPKGVKKVDYIDSIYKAIEGQWVSSQNDRSNFDQRLRAYGADLLRELFPPELQTLLWEAREERTNIQVISSEPFIPWEFLHLCDPSEASGMPEETLFLSQFGVIRWLDGVNKNGWPPEELSLRGESRFRYVVPDYQLLPANKRLPEAQQEAVLLQTKYKAVPVTPESGEVRQLISRPGQFDILHFACHGQAEETAIGEARLLMEGRAEAGRYVVDTLGEKEVSQFARLAGKEGGGPLVFLNACQAGRLGYKLTGVGGFAKAFLRGGSGVFVGALWSVGDRAAFAFCQRFYDALLGEGKTLADATIAAREAARLTGDATWLAYVVYGHPNFRVKR